jgi:energy-coupling factor transport system substrate-specific component
MKMAEKSSFNFTTVELVFIAIVGVVFGIVNNLFGLVYTAINAVNPMLALVFAPFGLVTLIAAYVVRKPGAAVLAGVINGLVQFLAGNPAGIWTLAFGLAHGIGTELVFFLFRYRNWSWVACFLASLVDGLFNMIVVVFAFGMVTFMPIGQILVSLVIASLASGVEAGLLGKVIGDLLYRTGLLKSFAISKKANA